MLPSSCVLMTVDVTHVVVEQLAWTTWKTELLFSCYTALLIRRSQGGLKRNHSPCFGAEQDWLWGGYKVVFYQIELGDQWQKKRYKSHCLIHHYVYLIPLKEAQKRCSLLIPQMWAWISRSFQSPSWWQTKSCSIPLLLGFLLGDSMLPVVGMGNLHEAK